MKLDAEQKKIAKTLIHIGKKRGMSPRDIVTAIATGLVESNLKNLHGGDADSEGWRQERRSLYPNPTNVKAATNRFYDELQSAPKGSIGSRAQAVQGSAYPERYGERVQDARGILKQLNKGGLRGPGGPTINPSAAGSKAKAGASKVTIPGTDNSGTRKIAALNFIRNQGQPGALLNYVEEKKALKDVPPTQISTGSPEKLGKVGKSAEKLPGGHGVSKEHLNAGKGAIKIGTKVAKKFGLTVTSTTGGSHVSGSYHYQGRAIDISGSPAQMKKAFKYLQQNIPHGKLTELFYDPIGHYWDNGQKVQGAIGEHSDHVHFAI